MNQLLDALQGKMANVSDFFFFLPSLLFLLKYVPTCCQGLFTVVMLLMSPLCRAVSQVILAHLTGAVDEVKGEGSVTSS